MLKGQYMQWQKDALKDAPLQPYELSAQGLSDLRRNIVTSLTSFAAVLTLVILFYRMLIGDIVPEVDGRSGSRYIAFFVLCGAIVFTARISEKSTDHILKTGLYWRISVSDELQDEWELRQKNRSGAKSFEWFLIGLVAVFGLWILISGLSYIIVGHLPSAPPFDVILAIGLAVIYGLSLMPLIHTAWTLEPITDETSDNDMQPVSEAIERPKPILPPKQKWWKRIFGSLPYVIGVAIGVGFVASNNGGPFYDIGREIGRWLGQFFG